MVKTRTQKLQEQIEELKEENEELKEQNEELYDYEGAIVCLGLIDGDEYDKVVAQNKKLTEENKKLTKERDMAEYHAELVSQEAEREVGREHKRYLEEHKRYLEEHESYLEMGATCEREVGIEHERYLETQFQFSEKLWEVCQELDIENHDKSENIIKEIKKLKEEIEELKEGHSLIYKSLRKAEGVKELMTGPEFECIAEAVGDYIQGFHEKDEKIEKLSEDHKLWLEDFKDYFEYMCLCPFEDGVTVPDTRDLEFAVRLVRGVELDNDRTLHPATASFEDSDDED